MVLKFEEMKELENLKHKNKMTQLKAQADMAAVEHTWRNERLDKLMIYLDKGGDKSLLSKEI